MFPRTYAFIPRARLDILLLLLALTCKTGATSGDSPISMSSDVWAMLTVNIGSLLVGFVLNA
ncbi:hypothetical protein L873DRAFT_1812738 [Choiromyces venosus 120613-1]|uniref:Uncharacterized protein n=1 Tax=Choiromyces venosus 120613-1 TaxID=1336337 RepID=A0A3N4JBF8_9PEZI|nr:hypothetical protein L873DRAFT_1812738 [Choiromyces venosus 120613-1]